MRKSRLIRRTFWRRGTIESLEPRRVLDGALGDYFTVPSGAADWRLDVLANDRANGLSAEATIVEVTQPNLLGTVHTDGEALFYSFPEGKVGNESFEYTVQDGDRRYTVPVTTSVEHFLLAVPDYQQVMVGQTAELEVLENDLYHTIVYSSDKTAPDGSGADTAVPRIVTVSESSAGATVTVRQDGKGILYTPPEGFAGTDNFTYTVEGLAGVTDVTTVTLEVTTQLPDPNGFATYTALGLEHAIIAQAARQYWWNFGRVYSQQNHWYDGYPMLQVTTMGTAVAEDGTSGRDHSTTNVQVAGVDEADLVKTDGDYLYLIQSNQLVAVDARQPESLEIAARLPLEMYPQSLYLMGDRLVVLGNAAATYYPYYTGFAGPADSPVRVGGTEIAVLDVSDPSSPDLIESFTFSGSVVSSRAVGDQIHLVLSEWLALPGLETSEIEETDLTETESFDSYVSRLRDPQVIAATLPAVRRDGEADWEPIVDAAQIYQPQFDVDSLQLLTVASLDVSQETPQLGQSTSVSAAWSNTVYATADSIYVLESQWHGGPEAGGSLNQTSILKFALSDSLDRWDLAAAGAVPGQVLNQFSVDQHDGYLRLATTVLSPNGQWSNGLYVLQQQGSQLAQVGQVEGLAPGERIFSVRFMGQRAYVVTFRQIDPLFTVDLHDPTHPQVMGELKIPGFSNYLHPVQENYLIGIGQNADPQSGLISGPQISLFDVSDLAHPRRIDQFDIASNGWTAAFHDHHAVSFFDEQSILAVPFQAHMEFVIDKDEDGQADGTEWRSTSELWVLKVDPQADDPDQALRQLGTVEQPEGVLRSLRIEDLLYSISSQNITSVELQDPSSRIDQLYYGRLAFDDWADLSVQSNGTTLDVLANDYGGKSGESGLVITAVSTPDQGGQAALLPDGRISYQPEAGFIGTETFVYTVQTDNGETDSAVVRVQIHAAPEAVDDTFQIKPDSQPQSLDVLSNDRAGDGNAPRPIYTIDVARPMESDGFVTAIRPGEPIWFFPLLTISEVSEGDQGGTITIAEGQRTVLYQPGDGFLGMETFTYQVRDLWGGTDTATVTVYVSQDAVGVIDTSTNDGKPTTDGLDSVEVRFSQDIGPSLSATDLEVRSDSGELVASHNAKLDWDATSKTARWDLSELALAPGWYQLSLGGAGASLTLDGNADGIAGDPLEMRVQVTQRGDVDLDGDVDSLDLTLLAENWTGLLAEGGGTRTRAQGDLDGDGDTDAADLAELILHWTGTQATSSAASPIEDDNPASAVDQVFAEPADPALACVVQLPPRP